MIAVILSNVTKSNKTAKSTTTNTNCWRTESFIFDMAPGRGRRSTPMRLRRSSRRHSRSYHRAWTPAARRARRPVLAPVRVESGQSPRLRPPDDLSGFFGRCRKLPDRAFDAHTGAKCGSSRSRYVERVRILVIGRHDPLTGESIVTPMMDSNGFVMDLTSCRCILKDGEAPPCRLVARSEDDLIELTAENFDELKLVIVNFTCEGLHVGLRQLHDRKCCPGRCATNHKSCAWKCMKKRKPTYRSISGGKNGDCGGPHPRPPGLVARLMPKTTSLRMFWHWQPYFPP